jgi:hypothetical protein
MANTPTHGLKSPAHLRAHCVGARLVQTVTKPAPNFGTNNQPERITTMTPHEATEQRKLIRRFPCCKPVLNKHEDGWDAHRLADCQTLRDGLIVPAFFDNLLVEDAPTKKAAILALNKSHLWGMCFN